jgi:hypothetical protein
MIPFAPKVQKARRFSRESREKASKNPSRRLTANQRPAVGEGRTDAAGQQVDQCQSGDE